MGQNASVEVAIPVGGASVRADLALPPGSRGVVIFAHGSGSGRHSPRNRQVAARLQQAGLATVLMDLLTEREEAIDEVTGELRFDIELLTDRLVAATRWARERLEPRGLPLGYFGASTGAAAALRAAGELPGEVAAVVSRGGRPDLAGADLLARVRAPTLLIVGGADAEVLELNEEARRALGGPSRLAVVPGAGHLFEEPGALAAVADLAAHWFTLHLGEAPGATPAV